LAIFEGVTPALKAARTAFNLPMVNVVPAPIASEALERIAGLYAVEKDVRGRSPEERRAVRSLKSRPLIDALEPWLRAKLGKRCY
jgi:hypothetical protein